jgi:hypothetical protein
MSERVLDWRQYHKEICRRLPNDITITYVQLTTGGGLKNTGTVDLIRVHNRDAIHCNTSSGGGLANLLGTSGFPALPNTTSYFQGTGVDLELV